MYLALHYRKKYLTMEPLNQEERRGYKIRSTSKIDIMFFLSRYQSLNGQHRGDTNKSNRQQRWCCCAPPLHIWLTISKAWEMWTLWRGQLFMPHVLLLCLTPFKPMSVADISANWYANCSYQPAKQKPWVTDLLLSMGGEKHISKVAGIDKVKMPR